VGDVNGDGFADVVVGAYGYSGGSIREGKVFVWHGSPTGISSGADWTAEVDKAEAYFGRSVGTAGDVNGDGFSDLVVGADGYDGGAGIDEGALFVWHGSAAGLNNGSNGTAANAAWFKRSNQAGAVFGWSAATAGDVNGDGYADIIVGAPLYTRDFDDEGMVWVYHGSAAGLISAPAWSKSAGQAGAHFGHSVFTAGDVNGDGYADVIAGAPYYDRSGTSFRPGLARGSLSNRSRVRLYRFHGRRRERRRLFRCHRRGSPARSRQLGKAGAGLCLLRGGRRSGCRRGLVPGRRRGRGTVRLLRGRRRGRQRRRLRRRHRRRPGLR
jgi:hypothetical protein